MAITKITTPELFDFSATNTALQLPTGDTASRPSAPSAGEWRFNTTEKYVEYWDGSAWKQIDTEELPNPDDFPSQNFNVNTYFGNGATQAIDAKFNEAANFNGSTSNIQVANSGNVFEAVGGFSASVWVNRNTTANQTILNKEGAVSGSYGWSLRYTSGAGYSYDLYDASNNLVTVSTGANSTTGNWEHIVISFNNSDNKLRIYFDGGSAVVSSALGTSPSSNTENFFIGARTGGSIVTDGKLDQVRIYSAAITDAQANDLYTDETTTTAATLNFPVGAGCIAAYQLDGDASDVGGTYGGVTTDIGYTGLRFQPDFVWIKARNSSGEWHNVTDSVRGATKYVYPNASNSQDTSAGSVTSFGSQGFTLGNDNGFNTNGTDYVAWNLKAGGAPTTTNSAGAGNVPTAGSVKIDGADLTTALAGTIPATKISANQKAGFSIVEYTGNSTAGATIGTGLSLPSQLIIIKNLNVIGGSSKNWTVYAEPLGNTDYLYLNSNAQAQTYNFWNNTSPVSGKFTVSSDTNVNSSSGNYIAYCFHSVDGYQKIGSYTGTGATGNTVETGFEPAFLLIKRTDGANSWAILDNKRSSTNPRDKELYANLADAESTFTAANFLTNGFELINTANGYNANGGTYIYLAIAADKDSSVPTQANSFSPTLYTGNGGTQNIYTPFAPDFTWTKQRTGSAANHVVFDTIRGAFMQIMPNTTNGTVDRSSADKGVTSFNSNGFTVKDTSAGDYEINGPNGGTYSGNGTYVSWCWKAGGLPTINSDGDITSIVSANVAAGFSIVKYTGNGTAGATIGHGLTSLTPSLIIWKNMSATSNWLVYSPLIGNDSQYLYLNATNDAQTSGNQNEYPTYKTDPTSTLVTVNGAGSSNNINISGENTIMYCFADIAGYQKVGTYNGNGGSNPINVGFQPRFVMAKQTTGSGGSWLIMDSARGANEQLYANLSASEYSDTGNSFSSTGFTMKSNGNWNASGETYIYLAIA